MTRLSSHESALDVVSSLAHRYQSSCSQPSDDQPQIISHHYFIISYHYFMISYHYQPSAICHPPPTSCQSLSDTLKASSPKLIRLEGWRTMTRIHGRVECAVAWPSQHPTCPRNGCGTRRLRACSPRSSCCAGCQRSQRQDPPGCVM